VEWNNSILLEGDVATEVARLKDQPGGEIEVSEAATWPADLDAQVRER
jgi:hypothetical protein